jgi:anti-anti-sigma factor
MNTNPVESARNIVLRLKELVRGQEQGFLEELTPTVVRENVALDFAEVERIDAAGLAALITLYTDACKAGHTLTVSRPNRHVREILQIVGLDRILVAESGSDPGLRCMQFQGSAA